MKLKDKRFVTIGVMCVSIASAVLECIKTLNAEDTETMVNRLIDEKFAEREIKYENDLK